MPKPAATATRKSVRATAAAPSHIKDLISDPENRRKHNPRNLGMVVEALHKVGAARSIVIDEDNVILAGNGVTEAAAEAGITTVRVIEADGQELIAVRRRGLTKAQKRALAIFDNRTAELAEWDTDQLRADIEAGLDLKSFFGDEELAALLKSAGGVTEGKTDPDDVPDQRATDIKVGDLFGLGKHRLMCGDSTASVDVDRLLAGATPRLMVTDPPYGVDYEGGSSNRKKREKLAGDSGADLYVPTMEMAARVLDKNASVYLWHAGRLADVVYAAVAIARFEVRSQIVWNKLKPHYGALGAHYKQKHEPCLYAVRGGADWIGPTNEPTVWDIEQARVNEFHPTQKPVECMMRPMRNHDAPEVYEPFSGSGSSLIAAEQIDRSCLAIELEPSYVQVAIDRWEAFTGQRAQKVGEAVHG